MGGWGRRYLSLVSISFAGSVLWEGCPFHMGILEGWAISWGYFFIGMGYGVVPATPSHEEQRSRDQLLTYTRSKVNDKVL